MSTKTWDSGVVRNYMVIGGIIMAGFVAVAAFLDIPERVEANTGQIKLIQADYHQISQNQAVLSSQVAGVQREQLVQGVDIKEIYKAVVK